MSRSRFVACPTVCRDRLAAASVQTASGRRNGQTFPGRDVVHVPLRCARPRRSAPDRPGPGRGRHAREQGPLTIHRSPDPSSPTLRQPAAGAHPRSPAEAKLQVSPIASTPLLSSEPDRRLGRGHAHLSLGRSWTVTTECRRSVSEVQTSVLW